MNGYIGFYNQKPQIEIYAETKFQALDKAIAHFNPPKSKKHLVFVELAEKDGETVIHSPSEL